MQEQFIVGQRWLSEAEPELGLGIVVQGDRREVTIAFPAAATRRRYASQSAPLLRLRYEVGDEVEDMEGRLLQVQGVEERAGLLVYRCIDSPQGLHRLLPEQQLSGNQQFDRPHQRLLARRIDPDTWFALRYQAWRETARLWASPVFGFGGPRIEWLPHQLFIASEVAARESPRVLLADEVGLGKTIEAGLVLHRLLLTERVRRVLLIVPEVLVHQWLVELLRRFNLHFAVFDHARFDATVDAGNPFDQSQRVLCSLAFLVQNPDVTAAVTASSWDLVIVDEAHHLHWQEGSPSAEYELVESLARSTPAVMLLTATPEQLGRAGHFGRLRLLDPDRFHDYQLFLDEERSYADVAAIAAKLLDGEALTRAESDRLQAMLGADAAGDVLEVIARLVDRHGTGRVLFRNTRQAISGFPARRLATYRLAIPEGYAGHADQLAPERYASPDWPAWDPRVAWLVGLARGLAPEKILVICARAETALALRDYLQEKIALRTGVFHEHMDLVARDRAAAFFADPEEGAQLLLCSEIGSEGRNFQFAHHLVMFDLPLDPELLEQRIGRLDRIGQRETVHLHVPYLAGSAGEVLLQWYRDGLGSFEAICPAAPAVHAALGDQLQAAIQEPAKLPALLVEASAMTRRVNAELEAGRDRLLELHSHQPMVASRLVEALRQAEDEHAVLPFLTTFWDAFGLEHEPGPGRSVVLREGSHMLSEHFPGLLPGGMTVTFRRDDALDHEDRQFLTWEHPMTRGCLDMLTSGPLGGVALTVCEHADFPTGSVLYEALFVVDAVAPAGLGLRRFLPPTVIRLLLDAHGEDLAERLPHDQLQGLCLAGNRKLADTVVRSQQAKLGLLQERAEQLAGQQAVAIVDRARHAADAELDDEYRRLQALARVNPNVRESELKQIATRRERIDAALDDVRLRFDALRLVVMR